MPYGLRLLQEEHTQREASSKDQSGESKACLLWHHNQQQHTLLQQPHSLQYFVTDPCNHCCSRPATAAASAAELSAPVWRGGDDIDDGARDVEPVEPEREPSMHIWQKSFVVVLLMAQASTLSPRCSQQSIAIMCSLSLHAAANGAVTIGVLKVIAAWLPSPC